MLKRLDTGHLTITLPTGETETFGVEDDSINAVMHIHDWSIFTNVLKRGDIGFAQDYIDGQWTSPNLLDLLNLMIRNREALEQAVYGNIFGRMIDRIRHLLNRNTKAGSKKNIHAHYDLGNAFYTPWLDASMTYSSALGLSRLERAADTISLAQLEAAQTAKYQRMLDELALAPNSHVLEIGCGWGGFAELAVKNQLNVTGLTLSTEQLVWAEKRLVQHNSKASAIFRLQDYRDTNGNTITGKPFDGIASIEMFEAVGEAYWSEYFACLSRNLKSGGRAVVQSIVIDESLFDRYRKSTDFIQQYIFPGGMLPSVSAFMATAQDQGLRVVRQLAFGQDYALTLNIWRREFTKALPEIMRIQTGLRPFDAKFARTWEFYLAYCEAAFTQRNTDVVQFTLEKC